MSELENIDLSEETITQEIRIDNSSIFAIEKELAEHSAKEAKFVRWAAIANREVARLELEYKITIATIVSELRAEALKNKKPIPPSAIGELRKSFVPNDKRYQKISKKLADAIEVASILNGLVSSWNSRGYRLDRIAKINDFDKKSVFSSIEEEMNLADGKLEY